MTDLSAYYVKKVRAGEADFTDHDTHSRVMFDGTTTYYDFTGQDVTADEFRDFVCMAWDVDPERVDVGTWGAADIFRADVE